MLRAETLHAWYGAAHVLQGVSLAVGAGEIVSVIGRNGAGKTTTLRTIMGLVPRRSGRVLLGDEDVSRLPTHRLFRLGIAYVPEDRRIVPGLSVRENLRLGLLAASGSENEDAVVERLMDAFPRLRDKLAQEASSLSGGEQQMLAIARAAAAGPTLVMLDEPTEGIMPLLVDEMLASFVAMKRSGTAVLLVEQNVESALGISDRAYILDQGCVVRSGDAGELLADQEVQDRYCAV